MRGEEEEEEEEKQTQIATQMSSIINSSLFLSMLLICPILEAESMKLGPIPINAKAIMITGDIILRSLRESQGGPQEIPQAIRFGQRLAGNIAKHKMRELVEKLDEQVLDTVGKLRNKNKEKRPRILGAIYNDALNTVGNVMRGARRGAQNLSPTPTRNGMEALLSLGLEVSKLHGNNNLKMRTEW